MLLQIAWKNIWRNKVRSLIVLGSVVLGLWVGAFMVAYVYGMMNQRLKDATEYEVSHFQLHHRDFDRDKEAKYFLKNGYKLLSKIQSDERVRAATARVVTYGVVSSAKSSTGGKFIGVLPESEDGLTGISSFITEGDYFKKQSKNKAIIGEKLAQKLKIKLRSKVVLTFPGVDGSIIASAFRVIGIYKTYNKGFEETNVYVNASDLATLLESPKQFHEIAALLKDPKSLDNYTETLQAKHPESLLETWKELAPELGLMIESFDQYLIIFLVIILLALSFGIINTMLMAVLERGREIGMMMAIGMNKWRLFGMIFLETLMLVLIAAPFGLLLAYLTITYLGKVGLDFSNVYDEGYAALGFKSLIYPTMETKYYFKIMVLVMITAILSSIFPAWTAIRLNPVEAMSKI